MTALTVAMVSYNARDALRRSLEAVYANTELRPLEVVVTDNASPDDSVAMIEAHFPDVRVLRARENTGFARASNRSWQAGQGSFVLFLNSDAMVRPGAIDRMVEILEGRPEIGALGPRLVHEDGSVQLSHGRTLTIPAEFWQKCRSAGYSRGFGLLRRRIERAYASEHEVDWVSAACLLTRRGLLERLGGFDERFFMYSEDVDLCARIRAAGYRVLYTPSAEVVHLKGRSAETNRERVVFEAQRSRLYFYQKHRGDLSTLLLRSYMALQASALYLVRPRERALYRKVLRLAFSGVQS